MYPSFESDTGTTGGRGEYERLHARKPSKLEAQFLIDNNQEITLSGN